MPKNPKSLKETAKSIIASEIIRHGTDNQVNEFCLPAAQKLTIHGTSIEDEACSRYFKDTEKSL
jgi:uncharacterized protein YheU (UPF0270 family)